MSIQVTVSHHQPVHAAAWDELCRLNGNINQSIIFDKLQTFYSQKPVYFEVTENDKLIGGVKMYYWFSNKLGSVTKRISKSLTQLGEAIIHPEIKIENRSEVLKSLEAELNKFILHEGIVNYTTAGMYGNEELLIQPKRKTDDTTYFNASYVDISVDEDRILKNFNRNTKRNLNKAIEAGLEFTETDDVDLFNKVLKDVYSQQHPLQEGPNAGYVKHIFKQLHDRKKLDIHFVKKDDVYLSASFFTKEAEVAYSWFGGSIKNELGSGQFLYWELMKKYKKEGIKKFYFGQVAKEGSEENSKFSGISNFKRGFGLVEVPSFKKTYILKQPHHNVWKIIKKLRN